MSEDPISGPNKWKNSTVAEVEELNGIDMQLYISGQLQVDSKYSQAD